MDVAVVDDKAAAMEDLGKVCVLFNLGGEFSVFLVDLDKARLDYGDQSSEIKPTFTIQSQYEAIPRLSHVLRDNLYVFAHPRSHEPALNLQAYAINLSEKINNTTLDLELTTCSEKCPPCLGPKSRPAAVSYDGNLLLFSSQIPFSFQDWISEGVDNALNDSLVDFEIYDPKGCNSRKLPQLHVCRPKCYNDYYDGDSYRLKLYDSAKSQYREEFRDDKSGGIDFSKFFRILSYCVDGDNFVVETDFGRKFCLNLKLDGDGDDYYGWRLCEEEGYVFESIGRNIVTPNGVCYDAFGANDYRRRCQQPKQDPEIRDEKRQKMDHGREDVRRVDFPSVIERGRRRATCAMSLLKDNPRTPCIVQATFLKGSTFVDDPSKLYWFLDVLNLDLEEELDDAKFAKKMMTTLKFYMPRELTMGYVIGLFYY